LCEYKPKEKNPTKKNKTANPSEESPASVTMTAAQEKQLIDEAIHFILNPATDRYSNEKTTKERIDNEIKAVKYLIQKKEQYSSTILQLSQNPTSNNKVSNSNYKIKKQAVKKVADSKKSKEEQISAYQKWVDYLIQQSQVTWKARCDKGFNEELCQKYSSLVYTI
jgi:Fe2+ transport system protein B